MLAFLLRKSVHWMKRSLPNMYGGKRRLEGQKSSRSSVSSSKGISKSPLSSV